MLTGQPTGTQLTGVSKKAPLPTTYHLRRVRAARMRTLLCPSSCSPGCLASANTTAAFGSSGGSSAAGSRGKSSRRGDSRHGRLRRRAHRSRAGRRTVTRVRPVAACPSVVVDRGATVLHPVAAVLFTALGAPVAAVFGVLQGAGNGILTIAKGTLPLVIFGPAGYGRQARDDGAHVTAARARRPLG